MFGRRVASGRSARIRDLVWPRGGWARAGRYLGHRVARLRASPHGIAAGLACGAAVSFTPFVGAHFLMAAALALLTRGSIVASAIGTAVGNPWTFPAIWVAAYSLGATLLPGVEPEAVAVEAADPAGPFAAAAQAMLSLDPHLLASAVGPLLVPMIVGSLPLAALAWAATYWLARWLLAAHRGRRVRLASG